MQTVLEDIEASQPVENVNSEPGAAIMSRDPRNAEDVQEEVYQTRVKLAELSPIASHSIVLHDDILVSGGDFDQHRDRLATVLQHLRSMGSKLNRAGCHLFMREADFKGAPLFKTRKKRRKKGRSSW